MDQSTRRGRPPKPPGERRAETILLRLTSAELAALDRWIQAQAEPMTRPEAVRRLIRATSG